MNRLRSQQQFSWEIQIRVVDTSSICRTILRVADILVYNLEALCGILLSALAPFHLKDMGSNALGVYVCQFVYIAVMRADNEVRTGSAL